MPHDACEAVTTDAGEDLAYRFFILCAERILLIRLPVPVCYREVGVSCHGFLMYHGVFRLDTRPRTVRPLEAGSKLMGVARYSPAPGSLSRELQFPKIPYSLVR
jgi:hypothetical protein